MENQQQEKKQQDTFQRHFQNPLIKGKILSKLAPKIIFFRELCITCKLIDVFLVSLLLTVNRFQHFSGVAILDFEQINVGWVVSAVQL